MCSNDWDRGSWSAPTCTGPFSPGQSCSHEQTSGSRSLRRDSLACLLASGGRLHAWNQLQVHVPAGYKRAGPESLWTAYFRTHREPGRTQCSTLSWVQHPVLGATLSTGMQQMLFQGAVAGADTLLMPRKTAALLFLKPNINQTYSCCTYVTATPKLIVIFSKLFSH